MIKKSRTLRRLGLIGVGSVIALGTPVAGLVGTASAVPATVQLYSQQNNAASTFNDGTNTTIKLSAVETSAPTGSDPAIAAMRFTYQKTSAPADANPTIIGTDPTFPWSIDWTPPSNGTYTLTAEPLASGGGSGGTADINTGVVVNDSSPTVHITSPTDGSVTNWTTTGGGSPSDYVGVKGTRSLMPGSGGMPAVSFKTQLYDENTHALIGSPVTTNALIPADGAAVAGADQTWNTAVPIPDVAANCTSGHTCDVLIDAVAGATASTPGATDEVVQAQLASTSQTLNVGTFTVTPGSGNSSPPDVNGTTGNPTVFTATAKDNNGAPMAGVKVVAESDSATTTINGAAPPATVLTNADGVAKFSVVDSASETKHLTFRTEVNGSSTVGGNDFTVTRTYITAPATISSITLTKTPEQTSYATDGYNSTHPQIVACLFDQNGDPFTGSTTGVQVQIRRSITGGGNSLVPGRLDGPATPNPHLNCYNVDIDTTSGGTYPTAGQSGSDAYDVFVDHNGTPGFQSGSSDVGATTTVNFSPGTFTFDHYADCTTSGTNCETQAQTGTSDTITAFEKIGGSAVPAGRTLTFTLSPAATADFPTAQPAGTVRDSDTAAHCTTDSAGSCQVNVSDANPDNDVSPSSSPPAPVLNVTEPGASFNGEIKLEFHNNSVAFANSQRSTHEALYPSADSSNSSPFFDSSDTVSEDYGAPGIVMFDNYRIEDGSGNHLADVPVTLTVDHGFFTTRPADGSEEDYNNYTFNPAAAAGAKAGSLVNLGQSITLFTNNHGHVHFALSIGRDAGFDDDGRVLSTVKVNNVTPLIKDGAGNYTVSSGNPAGGTTDNRNYTWTTNTQDYVSPAGSNTTELGDVVEGGALNGASVTIHAVPGASLTGTHTSEQQVGEDGNKIDDFRNASVFYATAKDQFGNLVGSNTQVDSAGPGHGQFNFCDGLSDLAAQPNLAGSNPANLFTSYNNEINNDNEPVCALDVSSDTPTTAAADTVTDTWKTQDTKFVADNDPDPSAPPFVAFVSDPAVTDHFTMNLYSIAVNRLHYKYHVIPRNIVPTDTTVHDEVTVTDQYGASVFNLFVTAQQSGPGARDVNQGLRTNQRGTASYNFHSAIQGNSVVTLDVYDCDVSNPSCSGIPLSEHRNGINFDAVPSIHLDQKGHKVTIFGHTRPGAHVQLFKKVGHGSYKQSGHSKRADNDGSYHFKRHIKKTTKFRVLVDGVRSSAHKKAKI
jgi:hypothetical protein